jgi:molybdopterin converting factor small subunit
MIMPTLKIPTPLRPYADGESVVPLPGETVDEVLNALVERHPALKKHLFNDDGRLRPFVNLFLGDENVNQLDGLQTPVDENDTLLIIPSIAGGSPEL